MARTLYLDRGILTFTDSDGKTYFYPATSGREGVTDPSIPWSGPIPPGIYTLYPEEITGDPARRFKWKYIDEIDWGNYRVPLHPNAGTNLFTREDFFLHGGKYPGSAGCIDVGNKEYELFALIVKSKEPIILTVSEHPVSLGYEDYHFSFA